MMKKAIGALVLASTIGVLALGTTTAKAEEVKENDNTCYVVESGDTLSKIADKYRVNFEAIHGNNTDTIEHADLIFGGQKLLVGGKDFDVNKLETYGTVKNEQPAQEAVQEQPTQEVEQGQEVGQEVVQDEQPVEQVQTPEVVVTANDGSPQYAAERMASATGTDVGTWLYIIQAESGNNPHIVNSIGCYGYFQIHPVHGMPAGASVDTQIEYAIRIYNSQGFGAWEVM